MGRAQGLGPGEPTGGIENVDDSGGTCRDLVPCACEEAHPSATICVI
jgi:hypothetical protein